MKKTLLVTSAFAFMVLTGSVALVSCEDEEPKQTPAEQPAAAPPKQTDTIKFTNPPVDTTSKTETPKADTIKKPAASTKPAKKEQPAVAAKKPDADVEAGKGLLAKSDCLACHKEAEKLIGPSYTDVAKKYADSETNIELLAGKIIKGGSGVWGQTPMTPHAALAEDDARKMVKYILSLNTE